MKGLLSTAASRAWLGVVAVGVVLVALVVALALVPRLSAGQELIDAAQPAMTDPAVAGEVAGANLLSRYVDLAGPLVTAKGGAGRELPRLVRTITRRTKLSSRKARALLRREAPHTVALLRALPFSGITRERGRLTQLLSSTLNITSDDLQDQLARGFPRLYQTLAELPSVTDGWRDVPGIEGLTRFDARTPVKTVPELRDYLRDDLIGTVAEEKDHFQALAGSGGIGYIPYLLLIVGAAVIAYGLSQARRAANHPPGKVARGVVVATGVLILAIVGALGYSSRLDGADTMIDRLEPAFDAQRVAGDRAGIDLVVQAVRFGDPIATTTGGAASEVPRLVAYVSSQAGLSKRQVRRRLRRGTPRTTALLDAIPLSAVAHEVPHLLRVLSRRLRMSRGRLVRTLRKRTPALAQSLLSAGPLAGGWNAIPGAQGLTRFDGVTPVRSMPDFVDYLDKDVVPVFETQRQHFRTLANASPRLGVLADLLLAVGLLLAIYGAAMMVLITRARRRTR
ncbi:MAG: hypothetical protein QOJ63_1178 [Solirubrobacteraceae bacterium]|jgi:hypothetical protein|nr:hypothetical protein [Solirubrobacteraceae bacterium]